ncbi:hypothetical protein UlMin_017647 [Ulmus minor]
MIEILLVIQILVHRPNPPSPPAPSNGAHSPISYPPAPANSPASNATSPVEAQSHTKHSKQVAIVTGVVAFSVVVLLTIFMCIYSCKKRRQTSEASSSIVIHPQDPSDPDNMVKIAVLNNTMGSLFTRTASSSISSSGTDSCVFEAGNLVISVQVLQKATKGFSPRNELGRGGFGALYKGELDDRTRIAVKRMESVAITNKALEEFEAEIAVVSRVRHRHLVSLLRYTIEGSERLLVYEYMPQGALSRHLFHWKSLNLQPLSWTQRFIIALDVARGIEYLHSLARQTFIHHDLKSSNILLGEDFRAKVSNFGLAKLAPDGVNSVATRLAGTFGYLAPEYAVMGKITTKADVFSFGVVLMELLTGLMAPDQGRPEESQYLADWFCQIKSSKDKLMAAVDSTLDAADEESIAIIAELAGHCTAREPNHRPDMGHTVNFVESNEESIAIIAELARHCTAREPNHRPDMGHAVNVLVPLIEKWKPIDDELYCFSGIDFRAPLPQQLKVWQEAESQGTNNSSFKDKESVSNSSFGFPELLPSASV